VRPDVVVGDVRELSLPLLYRYRPCYLLKHPHELRHDFRLDVGTGHEVVVVQVSERVRWLGRFVKRRWRSRLRRSWLERSQHMVCPGKLQFPLYLLPL